MRKFHFGCIKDSVSQAEKQAGSTANGNQISINSWITCNINANLIAVFMNVAGFIEPEWLVEIEADALISDEADE
jgi:hypothetical protein